MKTKDVPDSSQTTTVRPRDKREDPVRIGPYRILLKLGEGGMGEVFEAEQEKPVRRKVALKLIQLGRNTEEVLARFESERQALALMDHPGIAKVFDAGATAEGRPWFAMELVHGVSLTEYCDGNKMRTVERLELFRQVCDGVQHAHQKGVIHRDLKPSNILVALQDGTPVPKIIDFGVAKAVTQPLTERPLRTQLGQMIGTPEYMSPEQSDPTALDVDTRTDVYSLGVILYELLSGALPFDSEELRKEGYDGIRAKLREEDPATPSRRLKTLGAEASTGVAQNRQVDPPTLERELRGDLDWIVMKSLAKDRTRRYASPSELAADIGRHLSHEPVVAHPPSAAYLMSRFARRHRMGVALAATVLVALIALATAMAVQSVRIVRERDRAILAEQQAREAEAAAQEEALAARTVSDFLVDLFEVVDPSESRGNTITAREILDKGAARVERQLADQPVMRARMQTVMGSVYSNLGLVDEAQPLLEAAVESLEEIETDPVLLAHALSALGNNFFYQSERRRWRELNERAFAILQAELKPDDPELALAHEGMAVLHVQFGELEPAEEYARRAWEIQDAAGLAQDHEDRPNFALSIIHSSRGQWEEGLRYMERYLRAREKVDGTDHPDVAFAYSRVGRALALLERYEEAEEHYRRGMEIAARIYPTGYIGGEPAELALVVAARGRLDEAVRLMEETIESIKAHRGEDAPSVGTLLLQLSEIYLAEGDLDEAGRTIQRALRRGHPRGPDHLWPAQWQLARIALRRGERDAAEELFAQALDGVEQTWGKMFPHFRASYHVLMGDREKAMEILADAPAPRMVLLPRYITGITSFHDDPELRAFVMKAQEEWLSRRAEEADAA